MSRPEPLEARYRALLRLLPAPYRDVREEEMVSTFLDGVRTGDAERDELLGLTGRPSLAESVSVLALAVRVRLGAVDASPRPELWGAAVRRVALVGFLAAAVAGASGVLQELWLVGLLPWPAVPAQLQALLAATTTPAWASAATVVGLLWVAAYVALVCGRHRAARFVAVTALVPTLVGAVTTVVGAGRLSWWLATAGIVHAAVAVAVVGALAAFHQDAPPLDPRPWLLAFPIGLVVAAAPAVLAIPTVPAGVALLDWPGLHALGLVVAFVVHLGLRRGRDVPEWSLALALLSVPVLATRIVTLLPIVTGGASGAAAGFLVVGVVQATAVLAVGVASAIAASGALRALPAEPSSTAHPAEGG